VPGATEAVLETVSVDVPRTSSAPSLFIVSASVAGLGLKLAVAGDGRPSILSSTAFIHPPMGLMVTVYCAPWPAEIEFFVGVQEIEKSGAVAISPGVTARETNSSSGNPWKLRN
jgi:hypothetical protein